MDSAPANNASTEIQSVLIVGAGWVGRQIAARMAQHGIATWIYDRQASVSEQAMEWVSSIQNDVIDSDSPAVAKDGNWIHRFQIASNLDQPADLVIESVPEQVSLKKRVLRDISQHQPASTIIASNSSYFTPSLLHRFVDAPERFAHFHFHFPVLRQSVTDLVGCERTSPFVLDRLARLADRIGQPALRLRREHPGYVYNWLLQSVLKSALELVSQGVVSAEEVDRSWKAVSGMPLGPFGMMDLIGLDVIEQVLSNARWAEAEPTDLEQLIAVLSQPINQGHLGRKTGRGFYKYD